MLNETSYKKISDEEAHAWARSQMAKAPVTVHKEQKKQYEDPNLTLKPDLGKTLKKDLKETHNHTGVWEQRRGE